MARKEQRLIFTISKTSDGQMKVNMAFYPPLCGKEEFEKLTMERKEMQCMAADLGKFTMMKMASLRDGKFDEPKEKTDGDMPQV